MQISKPIAQKTLELTKQSQLNHSFLYYIKPTLFVFSIFRPHRFYKSKYKTGNL